MLRFVFLVLSLTFFAGVSSAQSPSPNTKPEAQRPKPVVKIQEQPGAPLKISTVETKWTTPDAEMLEIYVVVENVSDLEIRSYAWRMDPTDGSQYKDACFMFNIQAPGKFLKPGDADGKSTWRRFPVDSPTPNFDLSVDFAEFTNSSPWGNDTCRSGERLSGLRAGAIAAREKLAELPEQNRGKEVINMLKLTNPIIEPPAGHSPDWTDAFRDGVRAFFDKLRQANEQGGPPEVERVLQLPIDASRHSEVPRTNGPLDLYFGEVSVWTSNRNA